MTYGRIFANVKKIRVQFFHIDNAVSLFMAILADENYF